MTPSVPERRMLHRYHRLSPSTLEALPPRHRAQTGSALIRDVYRAFRHKRQAFLRVMLYRNGDDLTAAAEATGVHWQDVRSAATARTARADSEAVDRIAPFVAIDWDALAMHRKAPRQYLALLSAVREDVVCDVRDTHGRWIAGVVGEYGGNVPRAARALGVRASRVREAVGRAQDAGAQAA